MNPTETVELKILSTIRSRRNWYKYRPVLQPGFFSTEANRQIFYLTEQFFKKHDDRKLIVADLKMLVIKYIKDKELKQDCLNIAISLRKIQTNDSMMVEDLVKDFAKRQLVKLAITEGIALLDEPNLDLAGIKGHVDRAMSLTTETEDNVYHYFKDPSERIKEETIEKKVSTGIDKLDEVLDGGMSPGELCVFLGPPGRGKTTALINIGVGALLRGLTVFHVTLEISDRKIARRYDMRISGRTFLSLKTDPERIHNPLLKLRKNGCDLIIKDWSMESPTVDDLYGVIISYQARMGKKMDIVIVDYGDLLGASHSHKDSRFALEEIYTELRRLAVKLKVPLYTASQSNRESLNKMLVGMKDVAESFGKVKVADVVIGICQTPEEDEDKLVRLFIAKSRKASGHPVIKLEMDPDKMWMGSNDGKAKLTDVGRLKTNW